ncbi:dynamin family protein-like protein [Tricladium varicosporioides]|nr:dynamin family protein-like protein [Hymenoscyphus varicosporioides]
MPNTSLEELQTEEQRAVLDTIARVRKCGLEGTLSLPQIVVCGDQSAGKSSVLEAVTGIPFPRNDNLCTRYATEISLRVANKESISIRVIPDSTRPLTEQATIKAFTESITNFGELPTIMDKAMDVMGIGNTIDTDFQAKPRAFARDVLSIEITGLGRPQLTLVDIPGLIGAETKTTTKADIALVADITQHYIKQNRTICLAVVSAATDYANQTILEKVREVDPKGHRTLGVITKPDVPPAGSGSEEAYIMLAQNKDIFFELGWHVVKNRHFNERNATLQERNSLEETFFRSSNWKALPKESVGIDALRYRLSSLLFDHVKRELPNLRDELELRLSSTKAELEQLGDCRSGAAECKTYLTKLSLKYHETCKAAVDGHYEGVYFRQNVDEEFALTSPSTLCRIRAVVQKLNASFSETMRTKGHKYQINIAEDTGSASDLDDPMTLATSSYPKKLNKREALGWVRKALLRNRGKELVGNFNPLLIGELFWEQSEKWHKFALAHLDQVSQVCAKFLRKLLQDECREDVERRIWNSRIQEELKARYQAAREELALLLEDLCSYPINYNHYYTDTITAARQKRMTAALEKSVQNATTTETIYPHKLSPHEKTTVDLKQVVSGYSKSMNTDPNMDNFSCEEALDCLFAIYKVSQKTFVANVTMQVIERHIVRGLETIFSPLYVSNLEPAHAEALASEPSAAKRKRAYLEDQIKKLEEGHEIFRSVL